MAAADGFACARGIRQKAARRVAIVISQRTRFLMGTSSDVRQFSTVVLSLAIGIFIAQPLSEKKRTQFFSQSDSHHLKTR